MHCKSRSNYNIIPTPTPTPTPTNQQQQQRSRSRVATAATPSPPTIFDKNNANGDDELKRVSAGGGKQQPRKHRQRQQRRRRFSLVDAIGSSTSLSSSSSTLSTCSLSPVVGGNNNSNANTKRKIKIRAKDLNTLYELQNKTNGGVVVTSHHNGNHNNVDNNVHFGRGDPFGVNGPASGRCTSRGNDNDSSVRRRRASIGAFTSTADYGLARDGDRWEQQQRDGNTASVSKTATLTTTKENKKEGENEGVNIRKKMTRRGSSPSSGGNIIVFKAPPPITANAGTVGGGGVWSGSTGGCRMPRRGSTGGALPMSHHPTGNIADPIKPVVVGILHNRNRHITGSCGGVHGSGEFRFAADSSHPNNYENRGFGVVGGRSSRMPRRGSTGGCCYSNVVSASSRDVPAPCNDRWSAAPSKADLCPPTVLRRTTS